MQKKNLLLVGLLALLPLLVFLLLRPGGAGLPRASAAYTDSSFTTGYNISNSANYANSQHPRIAWFTDGYLHVTWMEGNDGAYGPAYVRGQGTTWPMWEWAGASNNQGYTNPALALGSDGTVHMVWAGGGNPPYDIYYAYKPAGGSWSTPVNISNSPYFTVYPSIAIDGAGGLWVAYQSSYSDTNNEILIVHKPAGGSWGTPVKLSTSGKDDLNASVVVDKDNVVHVVWRNNNDAPNWEIMYTKYAGSSWTTPVNISATSTASHFPRIATDSSGRLYVIWEDEIDGSDSFDALLRRSTDGGATWSAYVRVSNSPKALYPAIYADDACNVYAVWQDYRLGATETYFSRSTDCGVTWLGDENVSNNGSASYYPDVVAQNGGYAHIVWQDMAPGQLDIYYSKATIVTGPTPTTPVTEAPTNTPTATPTNTPTPTSTPTPTPDPRPQGDVQILAHHPPYSSEYTNQFTSTLHLTAYSLVGATVTQMWVCNLGACPAQPVWMPFAEYMVNWQLLDDGYPCGYKWVYAGFRDNRGSESPTYADYIQYDSFLTASMVLNDGAAYTNQTMVTVNSEDRDRLEPDCTGLEAVRLKESSELTYTIWMSYTDDIYFFLAPSGPVTRTVDAQYRDYAGNVGLFSDSIRFDINPPYSGTPPTVNSITTTKLFITVTGLLAYDDESGVARVWMANHRNGPWVPFAYEGPSHIYLWNLAYGGPPIQLPERHHIYVKYEDAAGWGPFPGNFSEVYSATVAVSGIRSAFIPTVLRGFNGLTHVPGPLPPAAGLLLVANRPQACAGELVDLYLAVRRTEKDPFEGTLRLTLPEGLQVVRAWSAYGTLLQISDREVVSRERAWSGQTPFIRVQARVEQGAAALLFVQGNMEWDGGTLLAAPLRLENR